MKDEIEYEDFAKLDIRIGEIIFAEKVENADKLIKCTVNFGELGERTIVSGILEWKSPQELIRAADRLMYSVKRAGKKGVEVKTFIPCE